MTDITIRLLDTNERRGVFFGMAKVRGVEGRLLIE